MARYKELSEVNVSAGLQELFIYSAEVVPIFIPLVLFALFTISCLGSFFAQKRLTGRASFPASFAVAGFITLLIAFMMTLIDGLINTSTLIVTLLVTVIGVFWLVFSRDR